MREIMNYAKTHVFFMVRRLLLELMIRKQFMNSQLFKQEKYIVIKI